MNRIALDWGSSRLRAYAVDASGDVVETRQADTGVFTIATNDFERALRQLIGDWLDAHPQIEICAAGMIGSANGWREAPYVATPASSRALRERVVQVPFENSSHVLKIIPGVRHGTGAQVDVMRGEETQIFGLLPESGDGTIVDFRTHYTGELYHWLSTQSSVSKVLAAHAAFDELAFDEAAAQAAQHPSDLLQQLFTLRASVVARERTGAQAASATQGALIGSDVANGMQYLRRKTGTFSQLSLVGSTVLNAHYARVFQQHGIAATLYDADATVKGLHRILGKPA